MQVRLGSSKLTANETKLVIQSNPLGNTNMPLTKRHRSVRPRNVSLDEAHVDGKLSAKLCGPALGLQTCCRNVTQCCTRDKMSKLSRNVAKMPARLQIPPALRAAFMGAKTCKAKQNVTNGAYGKS